MLSGGTTTRSHVPNAPRVGSTSPQALITSIPSDRPICFWEGLPDTASIGFRAIGDQGLLAEWHAQRNPAFWLAISGAQMNSIRKTSLTPAARRRWEKSKMRVFGKARITELQPGRGVTVDGPALPGNGGGAPVRLSGTLSLWRTGRPDHLTESAVIQSQVTKSVDVPARQPTIAPVAPTDTLAPDVAAGRAAFETYGESGAYTNPHDYLSPGRKNWTSGFERAARRERSPLARVTTPAK